MGDSISREFVGYLMSIFNVADTSKFEQSDTFIGDNNIRLTFQAWNDMIHDTYNERDDSIIKQFLDHFNIFDPKTSKPLDFPDMLLQIDEIETDRPDVFVMGPAIAYCLFKQTTEVHFSIFLLTFF